MSTPRHISNNYSTTIDSDFIGLINALNESIKEFYSVAKYNTQETDSFLDLFDPLFNSIASLLNTINDSNKNENGEKILENIIQGKNIVNQLKKNSNLNFNNLSLFFDDAKILFKRMRNKRNENLRKIRHSYTAKKYEDNNKNNIVNNNANSLYNYSIKKNDEENDINKLITLIKKLKDYDDIVGKFSLKAKNNFITLQKMILNIITQNKNTNLNANNKKPYINSEIFKINNNLGTNEEITNIKDNMEIIELKNKYENEMAKLNIKIKELEKNKENILLISNKAKKFDELKQKLEKELIVGNNDNILLLKDNSFEARINNLINTNKRLNLEIKKLKTYLNNLDLNNIQLKQDLIEKERNILLMQNENTNDKNNLEAIIKLKKDMQNLNKENNTLKEKIKNLNLLKNANYNDINTIDDVDTLNQKIEGLSKLLTTKMERIISLEKENINLKSIITDTTSNSSNVNNKINLSKINLNNINNNVKNIKMFQDNKKLRNALIKLSKENQELKQRLQNFGMNSNYIIKMQQELDQLRKIIEENNINNENKVSNYEQKINDLQNILNEKEALINQYENYNNNTSENNGNINKLLEEIKNKDKNISELKNKLINNEKQILDLNQRLKNSNKENNDKNQENQEMAKIKKEKDNLQKAYNELLTQNVLLNKKNSELLKQMSSNQNKTTNNEDLSIQIQKKQEEIEGLNTFIQKLTGECEKSREELENNQTKINSLQKENASIKKQLERLAQEMPKELNALKTQLDEANKKLSEANININNDNNLNNNNKISLSNTKSKNKEKINKTFDDGMQPEKYNNILSKLNQEISDLKNKNKELLFKLEDKKIKSQNSRYKTEDLNMSGYEEEFDLRKMATGARDKNRSEDINIDYPGIQGYKEKLKEYQFRLDNLEEQVKILLSKIKINNHIKPTFVQICQLLGYNSSLIEKMATSEKEKKKILGV